MTNSSSVQHLARAVRIAHSARATLRAVASWRTSWYVARPWLYASALLVGGVSIARSAAPVASRFNAPLRVAPVFVTAPTAAEMRIAMRSDTVARMLRRHDVDSLNAAQWAHAFVSYGEEVHVNPKLLVAIAYAESEFHPTAHSHAGAIGLMQVVPSRRSWGEYERRCGRMTARSLRDPHVNICFGAHIFKEFLTVHHGDTDHALAAYNNGSGELNGYPDRVYSSLATLRH